MFDVIPLSLLSSGQVAEVLAVAGQADHARRLNELGFRAGVRVEMVRQGQPCIVRVENSRLCFRGSDMSDILVRPGAVA